MYSEFIFIWDKGKLPIKDNIFLQNVNLNISNIVPFKNKKQRKLKTKNPMRTNLKRA